MGELIWSVLPWPPLLAPLMHPPAPRARAIPRCCLPPVAAVPLDDASPLPDAVLEKPYDAARIQAVLDRILGGGA